MVVIELGINDIVPAFMEDNSKEQFFLLSAEFKLTKEELRSLLSVIKNNSVKVQTI